MPADRFDLFDIARLLRRSVTKLALGGAVGALLAAAATYLLLPYVSEGTLGLGAIVNRDPVIPNQAPRLWPKALHYGKGLSLPELKSEYTRLDGEGFRGFLAARSVTPDRTLERVTKRLVNFETRAQILIPQYGSTRADLRELGELGKIAENSALGMRIVVPSGDAEAASRAVQLLGDFVAQMVFESQAQGLIGRRLEQHESQRLSFDNDLLKHRFEIATTTEKVTRLRALRREFPDASGSASRQVVSIAEGGARYLSPSAQVVGLEATVADLREQIATTERWARKAELLAAYYREAQDLLARTGDFADPGIVLKSLGALVDRKFAQSEEQEGVREARNDAALDLYALRTLREQGLRFVSGPTPGWRDPTRIWMNAIAGSALGILLVAAFVLFQRFVPGRKSD